MGENYHKKESKPAVRAIGEEQLARSNWRGAIGEEQLGASQSLGGGGAETQRRGAAETLGRKTLGRNWGDAGKLDDGRLGKAPRIWGRQNFRGQERIGDKTDWETIGTGLVDCVEVGWWKNVVMSGPAESTMGG